MIMKLMGDYYQDKVDMQALQLQQDCYSFIKDLKEKYTTEYQQATNIWLFRKLAEIELRLRDLENK
jgi:hypothetical protein